MKSTSVFLIATRAFCVLFVVATISTTCLGQNVELDPVLFDLDLQSPHIPLVSESNLNTDVLQYQASPKWFSMFSQIPNDFARIGSLTMRSESVPTIAGLGLLTISLMQTDHNSYRSTRHFYKQSETFHDFSDYAVLLGDGRVHAGIIAAFAGYGLLDDDSRALRTASQAVEAYLATGLTVQLLKRITGRESPICATQSQGRWKFFPKLSTYQKHQPSYYAYPSGHICTAMATLTVIADNYPEDRWIRPVGYSMIGALGVGLVGKGMHWFSDLPLGIAIGYLFGKTVSTPEGVDTSKASSDGGPQFMLSPSFDSQGGSGVRLAVNF